jgi:hypothetical protein
MVNFKEYFSNDKKLVFIISGGVSFNYLFKSNQVSQNGSQNLDLNGFNIGGVGRIGFEYLFSNQYYFGIAYHDYRDFNKIEKNNLSNKLTNINSINFSIGFRK